jgi:hypothetical protein
MKPVLRLSGEIAMRSGDNLAPLDISDQPRELRPIADAVARLLERLRAALEPSGRLRPTAPMSCVRRLPARSPGPNA